MTPSNAKDHDQYKAVYAPMSAHEEAKMVRRAVSMIRDGVSRYEVERIYRNRIYKKALELCR